MNIDISKISQTYGTSLEIQFAEEIDDLEVDNQKIEFIRPVSLRGKITNLEEIYILEGIISIYFKTYCDRCLEEFEQNLEIKITEKFSKEAVDSEDINHFSDDYINLDECIRNSIIINLPIQLLCDEKCKGLCPICGTNLNNSQCSCNDEQVDPRLEKLKNLLKID